MIYAINICLDVLLLTISIISYPFYIIVVILAWYWIFMSGIVDIYSYLLSHFLTRAIFLFDYKFKYDTTLIHYDVTRFNATK